MLKEELPLIISTKLEDNNFITATDQHKIQGLLYYHFSDFRKQKEFQQSWLSQWALNEHYQKELETLKAQLPLEMTPILLKGSALLGIIYQDFGSRFMSDIDLLIKPSELKIIEKALLLQGFEKLKTLKWEANSHKSEWNKTASGQETTIELHTQLYFHIPISEQKYTLEDSHLRGYKRLALSDQIIHLSTHYALQHNFLRLYWLFDLYFLVKKYRREIKWSELLDRAQSLQAKKSLLMNFSILKRYFNLDISEDIDLKNFPQLDSSFLWSDDMRTLKYFIIKHQTRDKYLGAFRYDFFWFLSKLKRK